MSALSKMKVLDLTQTLAGPMCTMILGDFGADVIKVEPPTEGDPQRQSFPMVDGVSAGFYAVNRNKRSLVLDLKSKIGLETFHRLVEGADVVVESFRPGVAKRLGIDYPALARINPAIILTSISGFGQTGPYSHLGGYDPVVQAVTGLMSATGPAGGDAVKISVPVTDLSAGMLALIGTLIAYVERLQSGRGQHVDTSLFDAGIAISLWEIVSQLHAGTTPRPLGTRHRLVAPLDAFATSDGRIMIAAANDSLWRRLTQVLDCSHLLEDPRFAKKHLRSGNVDALKALLEERTRTKTTAEWSRLLEDAGIPHGAIRDYSEVVDDPHVAARQMLVNLPTPGGRSIRVPGMPIKLSGTPAAISRRPPRLGEDSRDVLVEFGFSDEEIISVLGT